MDHKQIRKSIYNFTSMFSIIFLLIFLNIGQSKPFQIPMQPKDYFLDKTNKEYQLSAQKLSQINRAFMNIISKINKLPQNPAFFKLQLVRWLIELIKQFQIVIQKHQTNPMRRLLTKTEITYSKNQLKIMEQQLKQQKETGRAYSPPPCAKIFSYTQVFLTQRFEKDSQHGQWLINMDKYLQVMTNWIMNVETEYQKIYQTYLLILFQMFLLLLNKPINQRQPIWSDLLLDNTSTYLKRMDQVFSQIISLPQIQSQIVTNELVSQMLATWSDNIPDKTSVFALRRPLQKPIAEQPGGPIPWQPVQLKYISFTQMKTIWIQLIKEFSKIFSSQEQLKTEMPIKDLQVKQHLIPATYDILLMLIRTVVYYMPYKSLIPIVQKEQIIKYVEKTKMSMKVIKPLLKYGYQSQLPTIVQMTPAILVQQSAKNMLFQTSGEISCFYHWWKYFRYQVFNLDQIKSYINCQILYTQVYVMGIILRMRQLNFARVQWLLHGMAKDMTSILKKVNIKLKQLYKKEYEREQSKLILLKYNFKLHQLIQQPKIYLPGQSRPIFNYRIPKQTPISITETEKKLAINSPVQWVPHIWNQDQIIYKFADYRGKEVKLIDVTKQFILSYPREVLLQLPIKPRSPTFLRQLSVFQISQKKGSLQLFLDRCLAIFSNHNLWTPVADHFGPQLLKFIETCFTTIINRFKQQLVKIKLQIDFGQKQQQQKAKLTQTMTDIQIFIADLEIQEQGSRRLKLQTLKQQLMLKMRQRVNLVHIDAPYRLPYQFVADTFAVPFLTDFSDKTEKYIWCFIFYLKTKNNFPHLLTMRGRVKIIFEMYMLYLIALSYEMVIKDDKQRRVIEQMIIKINTEIITIGEIVDKKEMFYKEHGIVWIDDTVYFEIREIEYVNRDVEDYMTIQQRQILDKQLRAIQIAKKFGKLDQDKKDDGDGDGNLYGEDVNLYGEDADLYGEDESGTPPSKGEQSGGSVKDEQSGHTESIHTEPGHKYPGHTEPGHTHPEQQKPELYQHGQSEQSQSEFSQGEFDLYGGTDFELYEEIQSDASKDQVPTPSEHKAPAEQVHVGQTAGQVPIAHPAAQPHTADAAKSAQVVHHGQSEQKQQLSQQQIFLEAQPIKTAQPNFDQDFDLYKGFDKEYTPTKEGHQHIPTFTELHLTHEEFSDRTSPTKKDQQQVHTLIGATVEESGLQQQTTHHKKQPTKEIGQIYQQQKQAHPKTPTIEDHTKIRPIPKLSHLSAMKSKDQHGGQQNPIKKQKPPIKPKPAFLLTIPIKPIKGLAQQLHQHQKSLQISDHHKTVDKVSHTEQSSQSTVRVQSQSMFQPIGSDTKKKDKTQEQSKKQSISIEQTSLGASSIVSSVDTQPMRPSDLGVPSSSTKVQEIKEQTSEASKKVIIKKSSTRVRRSAVSSIKTESESEEQDQAQQQSSPKSNLLNQMRPQRKIPKKHHYVDVKTLHHKSVTYHARMTAIARFPAQNIRLRQHSDTNEGKETSAKNLIQFKPTSEEKQDQQEDF